MGNVSIDQLLYTDCQYSGLFRSLPTETRQLWHRYHRLSSVLLFAMQEVNESFMPPTDTDFTIHVALMKLDDFVQKNHRIMTANDRMISFTQMIERQQNWCADALNDYIKNNDDLIAIHLKAMSEESVKLWFDSSDDSALQTV